MLRQGSTAHAKSPGTHIHALCFIRVHAAKNVQHGTEVHHLTTIKRTNLNKGTESSATTIIIVFYCIRAHDTQKLNLARKSSSMPPILSNPNRSCHGKANSAQKVGAHSFSYRIVFTGFMTRKARHAGPPHHHPRDAFLHNNVYDTPKLNKTRNPTMDTSIPVPSYIYGS